VVEFKPSVAPATESSAWQFLLSAVLDDTLSTTIKKASIEKPVLSENQNFAQKLLADTRATNSTTCLHFGS
jgi:hypothetical protein